jgi:hypothetical protein
MAIELNYTPFERLLHRIAFASPSVQLAAADMEKSLFGASYKNVRAERPIFVTSLPRTGTTLMLEALHRFPSLASHIYRDMPFVMAPVFWSRLSGSFHKPSHLKERAHGDGMEVGYDSPEAFEEIIWRTFWPGKYTDTGIALWHANDYKKDARDFFVEHMKKVVALRRPDRAQDGRYVSKNNGNVARLELIGRMFPDAKILLPMRHPVEHARSLLHQHRRFLEMHRESAFVRRYMGDIGHYEFGDLHRPIQFPGTEAMTAGRDPLTLDYWMAYWIAAFEYILTHRDKLVVVSYEDACIHPQQALSDICRRLEIPEDGAMAGAVALFRPEPSRRGGPVDADAELVARAERIHDALV